MEFLVILILLAIALPTAYAAIIGAPLAITDKKLIAEIVKTADLKNGEVFYELGTGTGRVIAAFSQNQNLKCVGFELSPLYYFITLLNLKSNGAKNCELYMRNFFNADLSEANAIFFFLMPKTLEKLKNKFLKDLEPGTKIISYAFEISGWTPYKIIEMQNKPKVYFYEIGKA